MEIHTLESRADAALDWVRRSIAATGGQGSSHSLHPVCGWAKAYPETTGYLVETLVAWGKKRKAEHLLQLARSCTDWLPGVQFPSGAFPSLLVGSNKPSVFNTSQILFAAPYRSRDPEWVNRAYAWLLDTLDDTGTWRQAAFVPGYVPSYYTRAVWPVLQTAHLLNDSRGVERMAVALEVLKQRILPNAAVADWGFRPGAPAYTHTLAYTLEGFWQCALYFQDKDLQEKVVQAMNRLLDLCEQHGGRTPGSVDTNWRGDFRFVCITGNCQLSVLCHSIWQHTQDERFLQAARHLLDEILPYQQMSTGKRRYGGLPGAAPFWGAYLPFRYPNWAAKFFLDAVFRLSA